MTKKQPSQNRDAKKELGKELCAVLLLFLVVLTSVSLISYSPRDPSFNHQTFSSTEIDNLFGLVGAHLSGFLLGCVGISAFWIPLFLVFGSYLFLRGDVLPRVFLTLFGGIGLMLSTAALFFIISRGAGFTLGQYPSGGFIGERMGVFLLRYANTYGAMVILFFLLFVFFLLLTGISALTFMTQLAFFVRRAGEYLKCLTRFLHERMRIVLKSVGGVSFENGLNVGFDVKRLPWNHRNGFFSANEVPLEDLPSNDESRTSGSPVKSENEGVDSLLRRIEKIGRNQSRNLENDVKPPKRNERADPDHGVDLMGFRQDGTNFVLPPLSLLRCKEKETEGPNVEDLKIKAEILESKLKDFGVKGEIVDILPGPVITTFEYRPAPGVKISKIVNLTDDIALALSALSIRINAPIPGKDVVGVEIPNDVREVVLLREMLASEAFRQASSKLTLGLGKDILGNAFSATMDRMPHLLIAGATGTGKSVGLNSMIISLLYKAKPDEVKFIMVDPKRIELSVYDGIPHLISPVVTDMKKATNALFWAVREMERRYELLAQNGVRNLMQYNALVEARQSEHEMKSSDSHSALPQRGYDPSATSGMDLNSDEALGEDGGKSARLTIAGDGDKSSVWKPEEDGPSLDDEADGMSPGIGDTDDADDEVVLLEKLPYIVVIVDEFADLMMVASKDVESALIRLAQMARAAGIHLILATQRPSVDVLTGIIKANFPTRLSFQVSSRTDSRTILDSNGAERLLGNGDMLFLPPGTGRLQRIQGAYISEEEIAMVTSFLKQQQPPQYVEEVTEQVDEGDALDDETEYDVKYDEAVALVTKTRQASISSVQRHLRIGYNRAARIIETMEREGIVGPQDGSKPREVLVRNYDD